MEIFMNVLVNLVFSIFYIFIGILYDNWVSSRGYSRSSRGVVIFAGVFSFVAKLFLYPTVSWWLYSAIIILAITLGIHQFDRRETWYKGTFWWKREENEKKRKNAISKISSNKVKNKSNLSSKQKAYIKSLRKGSKTKQKIESSSQRS